ncbi:uncharacterized protein ARMOST_19203 [Armillaria ostoyae]|uniref:Uncharacterized protein n=1 Tax=Armillaria ostoyae TaxID=47428 RepID=A0A284S3W3_ARMOS|nr:uncharacterized protein ARMOST_19203 [Armillaria ostoyae]
MIAVEFCTMLSVQSPPSSSPHTPKRDKGPWVWEQWYSSPRMWRTAMGADVYLRKRKGNERSRWLTFHQKFPSVRTRL